MKTSTGLTIPEYLHAGASVHFFSEQKQCIQHGYIISIGEGVVVVQVHHGPERLVAFADCEPA